MYESLITYIKSHSQTPLSENQADMIKSVFTPKKLRKKQYFLQAGEVCKYTAFIVKGAMRQYSVDEKGNEHVVRLYIENWWAGDRESFIKLTPSIYNIEAVEDCDVLITTAAEFNSVINIPSVGEMIRHMDENHAFALAKRVNASISLPAEQRYAELLKSYPEFLQRFPQHTIASYIGITAESLSRIRKQALHK